MIHDLEMKKPTFSLGVPLWSFLVCFLVVAPSEGAEEVRPHILFIFADDMAYETIGAFGLTDIETPNLDRLVSRSTSFTRAYNMGSWSGAVCVASRHMLNTGAKVWKARKLSENLGKANPPHPDLPDYQASGQLWAQLLSAGGYTTYMTGKWHVNTPAERVFDVVSNVRAGMPKDTEAAYNRPIDGVPDVWRPDDEKQGGYWTGGKHWSEVVADDAVGFLGQANAGDKPAFFYIAFNAPHDPRQAPREFLERYPIERMDLPTNFLEEYPYKDEIGNSAALRDERLAPHPRTANAVKVHRREYYALVTHLDQQIGKILDELERLGMRDKTYIVFTADHGLAVGHHGLMGKQNMFEHSTKVPLLVAGPDIQAGQTVESPIYLQDIMPTTLDWAGIQVPESVEFRSLTTLLDGASSVDQSIYGAYLALQRSITKDSWKLIVYPDVPKMLLFDLNTDPEELNDLSRAHPERVRDLLSQLRLLQKDLEDPLDLSNLMPE